MSNAFTQYLAARLPSCREVTRLGADALDRPFPFGQRLAVRFHVLICVWCRRYLRQIAFLRQAVRTHPDRLLDASDATAAGLSAEARERLKQALRSQEQR